MCYIKNTTFDLVMVNTFEYRCDNCNKLLFKGNVEKGFVEVKCKCGHFQKFTVGVKDTLLKLKTIITMGK